MSRPTAVEGSTPGYRPITNHPDWALAFFGFVVPRTFAAHPRQHGLVEEGVLGEPGLQLTDIVAGTLTKAMNQVFRSPCGADSVRRCCNDRTGSRS